MMEKKDNTYYAKTRKDWRRWLEKNHGKKDAVWLIMHHKQSAVPSVSRAEAVEEALCFGWIDSLANKRDDKSFYQFFSKRKPKSNWSKINKVLVERLEKEGLMKPQGLAMVALAKETGTWSRLEEVDELQIPPDLQKLFNKNKTALKNWNAFSPSSKWVILQWILNAKKDETRQKRIKDTVEKASLNIKANMPK